MAVSRVVLAVFFVIAGLGGLISGARRGQPFDFVVAAALIAVAIALWPRKKRRRA